MVPLDEMSLETGMAQHRTQEYIWSFRKLQYCITYSFGPSSFVRRKEFLCNAQRNVLHFHIVHNLFNLVFTIRSTLKTTLVHCFSSQPKKRRAEINLKSLTQNTLNNTSKRIKISKYMSK